MRDTLGKKPINLYEALNLLHKHKLRKDMYKEEPAVKNTVIGRNFQINQVKLEDEETHRMQQITRNPQESSGPRIT